MTMLFINQKDIDDLKDEIEEEFGLKPEKNVSKGNNEKKQSVEDRIIKRCKNVIKGCSLALDQVPRTGAIKNAIECKTGKDFITEEELTSEERKKCAIGAVAGIPDFMPNNISIGGIPGAVLDLFDFVDKINTINDLKDFWKEIQSENENESKRESPKRKERERSRSIRRKRNNDKNEKEGRRKPQRKKK